MKRKITQRTPEQIEKSNRMKIAAARAVSQLITTQWSDITDASGPVVITFELDEEKGTATTNMQFEKLVEIKGEMKLDDGQSEMELNNDDGAVEGDIRAASRPSKKATGAEGRAVTPTE